MKVKDNKLETFAYICLCIATFGMVAVFRLIITVAIRKAFEE